jgi:transcriptional regulator
MYIAPHHALTDHTALTSLITTHPLGSWVCFCDGHLVANPVPFFLDTHQGPHGTLLGHVSRANPVWRALTPSTPSIVMFHGPQAYITPHWYPGKSEHGRVVPTWNYAVVHAHGVARTVEDPDPLRRLMQRLTAAQEAGQSTPWHMSDAPPDYIRALLRGIVGIEIPIDRLEGKLKASQDEALPDRLGTVAGLQATASDNARAMAQCVMDAIHTHPHAHADGSRPQAGANRLPPQGRPTNT